MPLVVWQSYGTAVDMWSVGCIFAELLQRKTLFAGDDYMAMLKLILECLGVRVMRVSVIDVSLYLPTYISIYLSIYLSIYPSIFLPAVDAAVGAMTGMSFVLRACGAVFVARPPCPFAVSYETHEHTHATVCLVRC